VAGEFDNGLVECQIHAISPLKSARVMGHAKRCCRSFQWAVLWALAVVPGVNAQSEIAAGAANVTVRGRIHIQHSRSSVEAVDDVFLRRARIRLNLDMTETFDARIEADFAEGTSLTDAWARLTLGSGLQLSVGQFKRPFSPFGSTGGSSSDLPMIERTGHIEGVSGCPGVDGLCSFSNLAQKLEFDGRDLGLRAEGSLGNRLSYEATLTNGEGANKADVNDARSASARLVFAVNKRIRIAAFAGSHDYQAPPSKGNQTERANAFGTDINVGEFRNGFHLMAGIERGDNWLAGPEARFTAAEGLASRYFRLAGNGHFSGVEPMFRVSWTSTEDAAGTARRAVLLTPGISLYVTGKNFVAVNLDWYDPDFASSEWSLKAQVFVFY